MHFYCWKASTLQTKEVDVDAKVVELSDVQREKIKDLKSLLLNDHDLAARVLSSMPFKESGCNCFGWTGIVAAVSAWEDYTSNLNTQIHLQLPHWTINQSIYNVQSDE